MDIWSYRVSIHGGTTIAAIENPRQNWMMTGGLPPFRKHLKKHGVQRLAPYLEEQTEAALYVSFTVQVNQRLLPSNTATLWKAFNAVQNAEIQGTGNFSLRATQLGNLYLVYSNHQIKCWKLHAACNLTIGFSHQMGQWKIIQSCEPNHQADWFFNEGNLPFINQWEPEKKGTSTNHYLSEAVLRSKEKGFAAVVSFPREFSTYFNVNGTIDVNFPVYSLKSQHFMDFLVFSLLKVAAFRSNQRAQQLVDGSKSDHFPHEIWPKSPVFRYCTNPWCSRVTRGELVSLNY